MNLVMYSLGLESNDRIATTFGGGFPEGSLVLMTGEDGAGKSVWSQRFLTGFCDEGYDVTYVTPELDIAAFLRQMGSLDYDVRDNLVVDRNLLFLNADVDVQERLRSDDDEARDLMIELLSDGADPVWERDIVLIDSFDLLLNNDPRFAELLERGEADVAMQNFVDFLTEKMRDGTTVVLTVNDEVVPDEVLDPLRNQCDAYFDMQLNQSAGGLNRQIVVRRFTQREDRVDDVIAYRVQPGTGIVIETRTVT